MFKSLFQQSFWLSFQRPYLRPFQRFVLACLLFATVQTSGCKKSQFSQNLSSEGSETEARRCEAWPNTYLQTSKETKVYKDMKAEVAFATLQPNTPLIRKLTKMVDVVNELDENADDQNEQDSKAAGENSKAAGENSYSIPSVYIEVKNNVPKQGIPIFSDMYLSETKGYVGANIPLIRELTKTIGIGQKKSTVLRVNVRGGSLAGEVGWVREEFTEPRAAMQAEAEDSSSKIQLEKMFLVNVRSGSYANTDVWIPAENTTARAGSKCQGENSLVDNISASHNLPVNTLKSVLLCAVGLGEGAQYSAKVLWPTVVAAAGMAGKVAQTVAARNLDIVLALGSKEARNRLADAGRSDEQRLESAFAIVADSVPLIYGYLIKESTYFRTLNSVQQSRYLCSMLGSLSFDILLAVASGGSSTLQKYLSPSSFQKLKQASLVAEKSLLASTNSMGSKVKSAGIVKNSALAQKLLSISEVVAGSAYRLSSDTYFFVYGEPKLYQGFKLHISANAENATTVASEILPYLRQKGTCHKVFSSSEEYMMLMKGKQSGKFITVYTSSIAEAAEIAKHVDGMFVSKKWSFIPVANEKVIGKSGAVSVRYGRHTYKYSGLRTPDGKIVPDAKTSWKPAWVTDPFKSLN